MTIYDIDARIGLSADFTVCDYCPHSTREDWAKGKTARRCLHPEAGKWMGRVVGSPGAANIQPPAWCPEIKNKEENP